MNGDCEFTTDTFAEQRVELITCFRLVEATQHDARDQAFTVPIDERFGERVCAIELGFAIGAEDEYTLVAQLSQQMAQEPQRAAIGPMQVVSVEEQRLFSCNVGEDLY